MIHDGQDSPLFLRQGHLERQGRSVERPAASCLVAAVMATACGLTAVAGLELA